MDIYGFPIKNFETLNKFFYHPGLSVFVLNMRLSCSRLQ